MSIDWAKVANSTVGDTGQQLSGVPSDMTSLAMLAGFRPNMYANPTQQAQNLQQYSAMLKNIMDQQMGGPNGMAARMAPGNPMAAMPVNFQNFYNSMAPLYTNPVWSAMGQNGPIAGGPGGYQFGPQSATPSLGMSGLVQALAQGQTNQTPSSAALAGAAGPSVMNNMGAMGAGNTPNQSPITVNTGGTGAPSAMARIARLQGTNALPQGMDPNNLADVLLNKILDQIDPQGANPSMGQGQQQGGGQGSQNPLAGMPLVGALFNR